MKGGQVWIWEWRKGWRTHACTINSFHNNVIVFLPNVPDTKTCHAANSNIFSFSPTLHHVLLFSWQKEKIIITQFLIIKFHNFYWNNYVIMEISNKMNILVLKTFILFSAFIFKLVVFSSLERNSLTNNYK